MSFLEKYGEPFGIQALSLLSFYGTLSIIVLGALIIGVVVQVWKHRSGGSWSIASLVLTIGAWLYAFNTLDPASYAVSWGGDQGWGALAVYVTGVVLAVLLMAATILPTHKPVTKKAAPTAPVGGPELGLSDAAMTPVLPRQADHSFRRKFFAPMVALGVVAFIAIGVLSVEKRQLDIFLSSIGLTTAEPPEEAKKKTAKVGAKKKKAAPKAPVADPLITQAQKLLAELGYDAGKADGTMGKGTEDAVRDYQGWEGLPRDGKINPELVAHMKKVKKFEDAYRNEPALVADYQPHANMCVRGTRAWYRSRTTKLSIDGLSYSTDKYSIEVRVYFSYPGEELERVRAKSVCKYSRYRGEMPDAPYNVTITTGAQEESLSDQELKCFSQGQPC